MSITGKSNEVLYKRIADNIVQLIDKVFDSPLSDKRWVWELIQNAKDVPNDFERVSIEIHLYPDKLVFKHNGNCFSEDDILGIVMQTSSKDSANEQNMVGKFGTGFITTHLLSKIIDVEGIIKPDDGKYHHFTLRLDRTARKSEDLIQNIKESNEKLRKLDENDSVEFPIVKNYENRTEDSFDTSFSYPLDGDDAMRSARVGVEDLVNTLPFTMVFLPMIKSVVVEDHVKVVKQKYVCNSKSLLKEDEREIVESCVNIDGEKRYFVTYYTLEEGAPYIGLSIEAKLASDGKYELIELEKDQPVLYRDFPLIGSEKFYFPYVLNGFDFEPTETRSGILLNNNEPKPQKNRAIIEKAIQAVLSFNEWLISQGVRNTYLMASSREPIPEKTWDSTYAKPWIDRQMKLWHEKLLKQELIETKDGYVELSEIKISDYGGTQANRKFYKFLSDFQVYCLPLSEQQDEWGTVLSWAKDNKFSKKRFFEELDDLKNISALSEHLQIDEGMTYEWLNDFYKFVEEQKDERLFNDYRIIPNYNGNFCLLKELVTDSAQRIPGEIIDEMNSILQRDLRDELVSEYVNDSVFQNVTKYKFDDLINEINKIFKEAVEQKLDIDSEEWERISKCAYYLISLHSNESEEEKMRGRMHRFVSHFVDGISKEHHIDNLPKSLWEEADMFVISYVPILIESNAENLTELGEEFLCYPDEHDEEACISWLNDFYSIVKDFGKHISDSRSIYPNREGGLKPLKELHYDKGIPSELIDLNFTATREDWSEKLLDRRIVGCQSQDPLGVGDIYKEIRDEFCDKNNSESKKMEIACGAISLIPNSQSESDNIITVHDFWKKFDTDMPECQVIENSSEFSWEIFVAYVLKELCDKISYAENVKGLSEQIDESQDATISYVDEVLEFAMNCYGKRYSKYVTDEYGLWINQNDDFFMFNDVKKDDNIDEDVKEFAKNPIVGIDFREQLLRKNMTCESFLSDTLTTVNILEEIDKKISEYVEEDKRNLQECNFTKLVTDLMFSIRRHPDYSSSLRYFVANKDRLFVGSIGDDETLSLFSSIASEPIRKALFTELNTFSNEELQKIIDGESSGGIGGITIVDPGTIITDITKIYDYVPMDPDSYGDSPKVQFVDDDSLTDGQKRAYNEEAKRVVLQRLSEDGFDISGAVGDYSVVDGVKKDGCEYPLVIKSYRSSGYRFHVNPNEWIQLMGSSNSMLLIHRGGGEVGKVTFSNLFRNQDLMSIQFSLEALGDARNVLKFAQILKYFKSCHFDFSNLAVSRYETMRNYLSTQNNSNSFLDLSDDDENLLN